MTPSRLEDLTEAQREAAHNALRHALAATPIEAVVPISFGTTTAAVFRIDAGGHSYLLRVEGVPSPMRNPHQYASMQIAADAGIAPPLHYLDEAGRVAVMDFVAPQPLSTYPGGRTGLACALGELLGRLQATLPFPTLVEYPDTVARLWAHVCRTGLFAPGVLDPCNARLEEVSRAYRAGATALVSSHLDPVPDNILFDGQRLWLIDWENGCCNDPLIDIAIVADNLARTPELERTLLHAWLQRAPDEAILARLQKVRALTRLFYAGVMFSASATFPRATPDRDLAAPSPDEYFAARANGRIRPGSGQSRHILGKMFLASFMTGVAPPALGTSDR